MYSGFLGSLLTLMYFVYYILPYNSMSPSRITANLLILKQLNIYFLNF